MSSRFTETEKWEDRWFRELLPNQKLLFNFICDKCDIAGFWEVDLDLAAYFTGIPKRAVSGAFEGLSRGYLQHGHYIWLRNFIRHQKNWPLNEKNNAHKSILSKLSAHPEFEVDFIEILSTVNLSPKRGAIQPPCKGNSKGKGNVIVKGEIEKFDIARKLYPGTKLGNPTEFINFTKKHKDWKEVLPTLEPIIKKQIESRTTAKTNGGFVPEWKHFSTWINQRCWEEESAAPLPKVDPSQLGQDYKEFGKPKK